MKHATINIVLWLWFCCCVKSLSGSSHFHRTTELSGLYSSFGGWYPTLSNLFIKSSQKRIPCLWAHQSSNEEDVLYIKAGQSSRHQIASSSTSDRPTRRHAKNFRTRREASRPNNGRYPTNYFVSRTENRKVNAFTAKFKNSNEIDAWVKANVERLLAAKNPETNHHVFPTNWSSRDETDFIRSLRDSGAYQALELYTWHFARQNVFVYTAAMSSLAYCPDKRIRQRAFLIMDKMDETGVLPSSLTFAALFQSTDGPEEAKKAMERLQRYKGRATWSVEAFNQAILACARQKYPSNKSWQVALDFAHNLRREGLRMELKTYTSLLHVCAQTGQLRIALSLVKEIQNNPTLSCNGRVWGSLLNVCAQAGDYRQANNILKEMIKAGDRINLGHCSAFLKSFSRHGKVAASLRVLDMMTGSTTSTEGLSTFEAANFQLVQLPKVAPDLVALNTILASCATAGDFKAARHLLDRMKNGEFSTARTSEAIYPDEISYSLLLSSCRDPNAAKSILKEIQLTKRYRVGVVRPSSIMYARAIAVCSKGDIPDVEMARFFLEAARKDGVDRNLFMLSAAIWTAERAGNYTEAKVLLEELKAAGLPPNTIAFTGVISAAARNGYVQEAFQLHLEMLGNGCKVTYATYNALVLAVRNSVLSGSKTEQLEELFSRMDRADRVVEIGGPVIVALINEYGKKGSYNDAKRVFDSIEGPSNGRCLQAILLACATASPEPRWEEAIAILHCSDITSSATGPGEIDQGALSNTMIACAKADRWEEALNLLSLYGSSVKRRSSICVGAVNAVMAACGRKGRPDVAITIMNDMKRKYGVKPDVRSYRSAVIACNQAEHQRRRHSSEALTLHGRNNDVNFQWWECALALLRRMKEDGLQPDIQTFSSCISACEAAGQWQRALSILQSMIEDHPDGEAEFLNLFCFNAAISACEKGGAWIEALEIYERMIHYGGLLQPNFVTLSSLVIALANSGQKELAQSKYNEGVKMRIVNPWKITKDSSGRQLLAMDLHKFNSAMASSAVRSYLDSFLARGSKFPLSKLDDLVIIVGKGLRSFEEPVLLPTLRGVLSQEYGIDGKVDTENRGRIVIAAETLRALIVDRSWK